MFQRGIHVVSRFVDWIVAEVSSYISNLCAVEGKIADIRVAFHPECFFVLLVVGIHRKVTFQVRQSWYHLNEFVEVQILHHKEDVLQVVQFRVGLHGNATTVFLRVQSEVGIESVAFCECDIVVLVHLEFCEAKDWLFGIHVHAEHRVDGGMNTEVGTLHFLLVEIGDVGIGFFQRGVAIYIGGESLERRLVVTLHT